MSEQGPNKKIDFDADFAPDERLFHYTNSQGIYGILDSGCLWATHFKFLNDSNEFIAARKSLTEFVEFKIKEKLAALIKGGENPLPEGVTLEEASAHETDVIVGAMYAATLNISDPFIFSSFVSRPAAKNFQNGELLHWATYGRDGGYALEINPHKLAKILPKETILSLKAVYVEEGVPAELAADYSKIGEVALEMIDAILEGNIESADTGKAASPFMKVACIIKDAFFKNEAEARLVLMRFKESEKGKKPAEVFIRHRKNRPIPYIKLFEGQLLGNQCPIEKVIIGPHHDRVRRKEALSIFLQARGLNHIEVIQSEVPYLGG